MAHVEGPADLVASLVCLPLPMARTMMGRTRQVDPFVICDRWKGLSLNFFGDTGACGRRRAVVVCALVLVLLAEPVWADPFRVVAVGASNTSGFTVNSEHTYPRVLEHMLRT